MTPGVSGMMSDVWCDDGPLVTTDQALPASHPPHCHLPSGPGLGITAGDLMSVPITMSFSLDLIWSPCPLLWTIIKTKHLIRHWTADTRAPRKSYLK